MELQAEPWFEKDVYETPIERQLEFINVDILKDNIKYASKVGFGENYLWGAEWWYYMKEQGHPEIWETVKSLFN